MSETVASYAGMAITLPAAHGSSCPCLVCADARAALGHRPLIPLLTPDCSGAGTSDDTAENTAEAKNLVLSSAPERSGLPYVSRWTPGPRHPDYRPSYPIARRPLLVIDYQRRAATRLGVTLDEYRQHTQDGDRWCCRCRDWLPANQFPSRTQSYCSPCRKAYRAERRAS